MVFMKPKEKARRAKVAKAMKDKWSSVRARKAIRDELEPVMREAGRRIVDLAVFTRDLWCQDCDVPMSLRFAEKERSIGLASKFQVRCHICLLDKEVSTSELAPHSTQERPLYAVNCKAAIGMLYWSNTCYFSCHFVTGCVDSGVGHDQFNKLLSAMNLPTITAKTISRAEKRMGPSIVEVAQQSCREAIALEKELTRRSERQSEVFDITPEDPTDIVVSCDFGWDKRGNGLCYNSHSGRGSMAGEKTQKILDAVAMSNYCTMCARGHNPNDHDCAINYEGSSKGMEPAAAVKL
ncbi:hypothetical protein FOCC_FOCC016916, partial [Frankliniella occidentalis]